MRVKKSWQWQPGGSSPIIGIKARDGVTKAGALVIVHTASLAGQSPALLTVTSSMHSI